MEGSGPIQNSVDQSHETGSGGVRYKGIRFAAILAVAFIEGAAVMVIELTAARLMTPYFGQSVFVWTNVIGIILAAMAVGNYFGGRIADRCQTLLFLFIFLLIAGVFCLFIPFLIPMTASLFIAEGLQLEEVFTLVVRGSFITTILLFAPPVILAGACLPFLVKAATTLYGKVGYASGSVYGVSTLGSITGTFLSTYLLIEWLGSKATFWFTGITLILLSAAGMMLGRRRSLQVTGILIFIISVILTASGLVPDRSFKPTEGLLEERETRYQYVNVIRTGREPETIHLCINEGLDSYHSIYVKDNVLTGGQYYDYYTLLPNLAGITALDRICIVGLAAGTIARQYTHFFGHNPDLRIDGVELDPVTVELGRKYMDLDFARDFLTVYPDLDGRMYLQVCQTTYDVIIVDAYAQQIYIPFHLATQEFFELVYDRLDEGGIMGMNVSGFFWNDNVLSAIANTAASVFGSVSVARVPAGRNFMVYAIRGKGHVDPQSVRLEARLADLEPLLSDISAFGLTREVPYDPTSLLLTDDRAPLERLCDADLMACSRGLIDQTKEKAP